MARVLLVGEQFTSLGFEMKGFDIFTVSSYQEDGSVLIDALTARGHEAEWIRSSHAAVDFPEDGEVLASYDTIILSDIGANTLLFHPEMLASSKPHPDRLRLLREYVREGGGLLMIGGWMSFSGIQGRAKYYDSYLEEALPVRCLAWDDRMERPEGLTPEVRNRGHEILAELPESWPYFLGYNKVLPRDEAEVLLTVEDNPLLCVREFGKGRSAAFTSDCAPHWGTREFLQWDGYGLFWSNLVNWLSRKQTG